MEPTDACAALPLTENCSASSSSEPLASTQWDLVHAIIPPYIFTISLLGLLLNIFVLGVFLSQKDRMTAAEIYLSNLALADFTLLCCLPFWAMNILNHFHWRYGDALCKIINSIILVNYYTSVYTLVTISVDRYLAIVQPMKARWLRRTVPARVICFILWILGILLSTPAIVNRKVKLYEYSNLTVCMLDYSHGSPWKWAHQIMMNSFGFLLPSLVIVFSAVSIIRVLAQRKQRVGLPHATNTKASALLYAVTLAFLICWGPFQVLTCIDTLCDIPLLEDTLCNDTLDIGHQFAVYLAFLNSTVNPLLYVLSGQYFRRKVSAIYRRTRHHHRGSDMTTYQRTVVSTYVNRSEQIKPVVIS